jgi:hypothetical protein
MADESEDQGSRISELVKKLMVAGLGAAFMTEEAIRSQLTDLRLPKEVLNTILQGASKSKEELVQKVGNETMRLISKIDFVKEAARFAETHKFKIQAEIEIIKRE